MTMTSIFPRATHKYILLMLFYSTVSFRSRVLPHNSMWMEDAKLKGLEICHPQVSPFNVSYQSICGLGIIKETVQS